MQVWLQLTILSLQTLQVLFYLLPTLVLHLSSLLYCTIWKVLLAEAYPWPLFELVVKTVLFFLQFPSSLYQLIILSNKTFHFNFHISKLLINHELFLIKILHCSTHFLIFFLHITSLLFLFKILWLCARKLLSEL